MFALVKYRRMIAALVIVFVTFPVVSKTETSAAVVPAQWQVADLVATASHYINEYWRDTFIANGRTYTPPRVIPYTGAIQTPCGETVPGNAFFCSGNNAIYYHVRFFEEELREHGDFAVVTILAHEWGHLAQHQLGISGGLSIFRELQADCFAGAFARRESGTTRLERGDVEKATTSLFTAGDTSSAIWLNKGAHGTSSQRISAFVRGMKYGVARCGTGDLAEIIVTGQITSNKK